MVLPLATLAQQMYQAGVNQGMGDEDDAAVIKVLEGLAEFTLADVDK